MTGKPDVLIIGAGISGLTIAERCATVLGKKVLVIEKRDHIGGNCYDFYNEDGIQVSKYGAHLFHTNYDDVWEYVQKFSAWRPHTHKVLSFVDGKLVPIPVNIDTVNILFGLNLNEESMKSWLEENQIKIDNPKNSEEMALSRIGRVLYEKMIKNYTYKQWDMWPSELDASVLARIPVRFTHDDRYFNDTYQSQPVDGFTKLFDNMANNPNIEIQCSTDYFEIKDSLPKVEKIFYTGPIDGYFDKTDTSEKLQYRSLRFEWETVDRPYYQNNSVINYPNDYEYTRIVEYKHITKQVAKKTTVSREYACWDGEPYYPVPNPENQKIYDKYRVEAEKLHEIYFVGRLANYKYFNMDQAFKNALDLFKGLNRS